MTKRSLKTWLVAGLAVIAAAGIMATPATPHHSFAMYDDAQTRLLTGVVLTVNPDANHLTIDFAILNDARSDFQRNDAGQAIVWKVEMGGSAAMAAQGVSVNAFPRGTIFSVGLNPLRTGLPGGSRTGGLYKCPPSTPPPAGQHCDTVQGSTSHGDGSLAVPTPA